MSNFRPQLLVVFLFLGLATQSSIWPVPEAGFTPLFNGKDLAGWEGDRTLWLVENGMIVGRSAGSNATTFSRHPELWRLHPEALVPTRRR